MKLSIIIPVYNEAATVAEVIERVKALDIDKEIIIVNDGSTDRTMEVLAPYASESGIIVHDARINQGKGVAQQIGLTYVTGDAVIFQDGDLELDPEQILELAAAYDPETAPVVYGSRFLKPVEGALHSGILANKVLSTLTSLLCMRRITDVETCYALCETNLLRSLNITARHFEIGPEMTVKILKRGIPIREIAIDYHPRSYEEGKKINWKDGFAAIYHILRFRLRG